MMTKIDQSTSRSTARWAMLGVLVSFLSACSLVPDGTPRVTPNNAALLDRVDDNGTITLLYNTALMNRPEAEAQAQLDCQQQGLTLDQLRHPAQDTTASSTITFSCRRVFGG